MGKATPAPSVHETFTAALDALVAQIRQDRSILAAILCGSLAHDTVWAKSDIDLGLITIDEKKLETTSVSLNADGINVHAFLMTRSDFRRAVEGTTRNSFGHSMLAKGRLLYSHDPTIEALCGRLQEIGERDTMVQLLRAGTNALPPIDKAHKWWVTRRDLDYTALWILYAATPLAAIEVIGRRLLADRELLPQAMTLNPAFFTLIYKDMLNAKKTEKGVTAALAAIDGYVAKRAPQIFKPVLDYLEDAGDARSSTEIELDFHRNCGVGGVTTACEYLADHGYLGKAGTPVRLTKKSTVQVQEQSFYFVHS